MSLQASGLVNIPSLTADMRTTFEADSKAISSISTAFRGKYEIDLTFTKPLL